MPDRNGPDGRASNRPPPGEGVGTDREWICTRCGDVHRDHPRWCQNCQSTVFEPDPPIGEDEASSRNGTPVSSVVVEAVAVNEGVHPTDVGPPLHDVIDPDALETVVSDLSDGGEIRFEYDGYEVIVTADGEVEIREGS